MVVDSGRSSQTGLMQQAQKSRIDALSGENDGLQHLVWSSDTRLYGETFLSC